MTMTTILPPAAASRTARQAVRLVLFSVLLGVAWSSRPAATAAQSWNAMARPYYQNIGERFTVTCPSRPRGAIRNAWGTDLYADFSSICEAALHAGAITAAGGSVTIEMRPSANNYQGSYRNGVRSVSYGKAVSSFVVIPAGGASAYPQRVVYIYVNYATRPATIGVADASYNQPGWQRLAGPYAGASPDFQAWQNACDYHRQPAYNAPDIVQGRINCRALGR